MSLIDRIKETEIHRATYIAILDSVLTSWGDKRRFAEKIGLAPESLSRIMAITGRTPSRLEAEKIAQGIPLPAEQRWDLLQHMMSAREEGAVVRKSVRQYSVHDKEWLSRYSVGELIRAHWLASYSQHPHETRLYFNALFKLSDILAREFYSLEMWLAAAEAHILANDALGVLNRPGGALYHAQRARTILEHISDPNALLIYYMPSDRQLDVEYQLDFHDLEINAWRIEAVSYNQLGLYTNADINIKKVEESQAMKRKPDVWLSHLLRNKLDTLGNLRLVLEDDLEACAQEGYPLHEKQNNQLGLLLINISLAKGLIRRENYGRAIELLNKELSKLNQSPEISGQMPKAMLLRSLAYAHYQQGNIDEWKDFVRQALILAHRGGFLRILSTLSRAYESDPRYVDIQAQVIDSLKGPASTQVHA
jgi:tetratricopeptide (TPR) repeat protein